MALHQLDPDRSRPMLEYMTILHYPWTNPPSCCENWLLNMYLALFTCKLCAVMLFNATGLREEEWETTSKVSQSCRSQCTSLPSFRVVVGTKLGWECSQGRKQQTTNTPLFSQEQAHSSKRVPNTVNMNAWLSNNPECESFCKTRARTLPNEILCLKMKSTADYSRLKLNKEPWLNAMCKS